MAKANTSGFDKKMRLARTTVQKQLPFLIQDAAAYTLGKLVQEVLNGQSGTDYPKQYPTAVAEGATGFVGVVTSNLRRSIQMQQNGDYEIQIRQVFQALAPYHDEMITWSVERYGMSFYSIAVQLYGEFVGARMVTWMLRVINGVDEGREIGYRNPFPG